MDDAFVEFGKPEDAFSFNRDGEAIPLGNNKERLSNSHYWDSQLRKVALVGLVAGLILTFTLLNESKILQTAWDFIIGSVGGLFGMILQPYIDLFAGFLSKG
jgi:hypothetical protein